MGCIRPLARPAALLWQVTQLAAYSCVADLPSSRFCALAGATPKDAFFVKVGLGETMTAQDILDGKLIIQVGLAAVRPAEFIILQFSHKLQQS